MDRVKTAEGLASKRPTAWSVAAKIGAVRSRESVADPAAPPQAGLRAGNADDANNSEFMHVSP